MKQTFLFAAALFISFSTLGAEINNYSNSVSVDSENGFQPQVNPLNLVLRDGRLKIELAQEFHSGNVYLCDLLGNRILESTANDNIDWSLANLKSGVYFVIWKDNKTSFTRKFIHKQDN